MKQLHQDGESCETASDNKQRVCIYPGFHFGSHKRQVFRPFDEQEIYNRGGAQASENTDFKFQPATVVERENHT